MIDTDELNQLRWCIEDDGLEYAFVHQSDWKQIEDSKFHELKNNFIAAAKQLRQYLNDLYDKANE